MNASAVWCVLCFLLMTTKQRITIIMHSDRGVGVIVSSTHFIFCLSITDETKKYVHPGKNVGDADCALLIHSGV